jgi:hypothetical protein
LGLPRFFLPLTVVFCAHPSSSRGPPMTATDRERDDAYRAVGRYVVEFSRLVFHMRLAIEENFAGVANQKLAARVLNRVPADGVRRDFFSLCKESGLKGAEKDIAKCLEDGVRREVERRNKFAHSDWWIGVGSQDGEAGKPTLSQAGFLALTHYSISELDDFSDHLHTLRQQVAEFGDLCLGSWALGINLDPTARVGDIFTLEDGVVRRNGPLVESVGLISYS